MSKPSLVLGADGGGTKTLGLLADGSGNILAEHTVGASNPNVVGMLPEVPTAAEAGVSGIEVASLFGVMAPAGTPAPIVAKLNAEIQKILATPEAQEQLLLQGAYAIRMTPEQSGERIRKEISQWAKVIDEAKIKTD